MHLRKMIDRPLFTCAAVAALALCPARAVARVLYIKPAVTGAGDCSSWADACSLQKGLTGASAGDEIWVMQGTYSPGPSRADSFQLVSGVAVYGGFAGTETGQEQRDPRANPTILSGDVNGDDGPDFSNNDENNYHVVTGSGTDGSAVLDGVTVEGGNASGSDFLDHFGGGMFNASGNPTLTNVTFTANFADDRGGGMYNSTSSPRLDKVTFSGNYTYFKGGGMYNFSESNPTLTNVTFSANGSYWGGGGMFNSRSSPVLNNVTFSGNGAIYGGGIWNGYDSNPPSGDATSSAGGSGSSDASNPVLTNVIMWDDWAPVGQEIYNTYASAVVTDSVIEGGCVLGCSCTNIITTDPMLGPLADNGGWTQTFALQSGSSAIDAGGANSSCAETDQRGVTRPQGAGCDIGAYEATAVKVPGIPAASPSGLIVLVALLALTGTAIVRRRPF